MGRHRRVPVLVLSAQGVVRAGGDLLKKRNDAHLGRDRQGSGGDFHLNEIRFIVTQGQGSAHDPEGNWVVERRPLFHRDLCAGNKPHFADPATEFTAYLDGDNGAALVEGHISQINQWHVVHSWDSLSLAQLSRRVTIRLKTGFSGVLATGSRQKYPSRSN